MTDNGKFSMKPMLAAVIKEAVKWAITDSLPYNLDGIVDDAGFDELETIKMGHRLDPYSIPDDLWAKIDPMALAGNIVIRLVGPGNWFFPSGDYSGNMSAQDIFEASFDIPDSDPNGDVKAWLSGAGFGEAFPISSLDDLKAEEDESP